MKLSESAITSFQKIYQTKYGVLLSVDEAESKALELMSLFTLVYEKVPKADQEKLESLKLE